MVTLARRLRALRERTGMTHQTLADRCGVGLRITMEWQATKDPQWPSPENLQRLADVLLDDVPAPRRLSALLDGVRVEVER